MTAADYLAKAKALSEDATDGPWTVTSIERGDHFIETPESREAGDSPAAEVHAIADAEFIAFARDFVPKAVAALEAVQALEPRAWDVHQADDPESRAARAYNSALNDARRAIEEARS